MHTIHFELEDGEDYKAYSKYKIEDKGNVLTISEHGKDLYTLREISGGRAQLIGNHGEDVIRPKWEILHHLNSVTIIGYDDDDRTRDFKLGL